MASQKQIEANRANAKKSTGPKTEAGKLRSRKNSWKHGLSSEMLVIVGECPDDFDELRSELMAHYDPQSVFQAELVERLAGILWRLRRVPFFEAAIFDARNAEVSDIKSGRHVVCWYRSKRGLDDPDAAEAGSIEALSVETGQALIWDGKSGDALSKLGRYDQTLMNSLRKTLDLLHEAREREAVAPLIIDGVAHLVEDSRTVPREA